MSFSSCNALQVWATGDHLREDADVMFLLFVMLLVPRLEVVMAWFLQTVSVPSHDSFMHALGKGWGNELVTLELSSPATQENQK